MLGRFTSPDSIIPDPGSVIGYNRYAYVSNNPMVYTDPSGYCIAKDGSISTDYPFGTSGLCSGDRGSISEQGNSNGSSDGTDSILNFDTDCDGISDKPNPEEELIFHPDHTCEHDNLVECFYSAGYWPSGDYTFTDEEWNDFTMALYLDIWKRANIGEGFWTWQWDGRVDGSSSEIFIPFHTTTYFNREWYDTPFWNGSETKEPPPYVGNICFENGSCYDRNDVNYIAQGMWSAAGSEARIGAWSSANVWKIYKYQHGASADVNYWAQQGVTIYNSYNYIYK